MRQGACGGMPQSNAYPTWPPPPSRGFIYPVLSKNDENVVGAIGADPDIDCPGVAPWSDAAPEGLQPTRAMQRAEAAVDTAPHGTVSGADAANDNVELSEIVARSILHGETPNYAFGDAHAAESGDSVYRQAFGNDQAFGAGNPNAHDEYNSNHYESDASGMSLDTLIPCMGNTFTGIVYDMQHIKEIPDGVNKFNYIFVRDDRWKYGLLFFLFLFFLILLIVAAATSATTCRPRPTSTMPRKVIDLNQLAGGNDYEIIIRKS